MINLCFDFNDDHILTNINFASLKFKLWRCTDGTDNDSGKCASETEIEQFLNEGRIVVTSIAIEEVLDFNIHGGVKPVNLLF